MARRRPWVRRPGLKSNSTRPAANAHCGRQIISIRTGISFLRGRQACPHSSRVALMGPDGLRTEPIFTGSGPAFQCGTLTVNGRGYRSD